MKGRKRAKWDAQIDVEKMNVADHLISKGFPDVIRDTYLRGKTEFRDFLYEKKGCSLLEAKVMIDALEKNGKIEFRKFRKSMRYGTWEIHNKP